MTKSTGLSGYFIKVFTVFLLLTLLFTAAAFSSAAEKPIPKRVLAIFVFKKGMPGPYRIEESLRAALASDSSYPIELDVEYADQSRFPEKKYLSKIMDLYRYKYGKQKVDLVLAMGDESTDWMLEYGEPLFGDIPMVLITADRKHFRLVA